MAGIVFWADENGYLVCPRRGEISVEWCEGCPERIVIADHGDRTVVVCRPVTGEAVAGRGPSGLRDVPDLWR